MIRACGILRIAPREGEQMYSIRVRQEHLDFQAEAGLSLLPADTQPGLYLSCVEALAKLRELHAAMRTAAGKPTKPEEVNANDDLT